MNTICIRHLVVWREALKVAMDTLDKQPGCTEQWVQVMRAYHLADAHINPLLDKPVEVSA